MMVPSRLNKLTRLALAGGILAVLAIPSQAAIITGTVDGTDNLYFEAWGHPYGDAIGTGTAASALDYAFTSGQTFSITATGCVVDAGAICTSPDGIPADGIFRGLTVYALIGVWSTDATHIDPVTGGSAFVVGSSNNLVAPTYAGNLYLFLADNDGVFSDNPPEYHYTVEVPVPDSVPEPGSLALMGAGLMGLGLAAGARKRAAKAS